MVATETIKQMEKRRLSLGSVRVPQIITDPEINA
jgi:hypothetical protein